MSPQQLKEFFKEAKDIFKPKIDESHKNDIAGSSILQKMRKDARKKDDLFTGCAEMSYRKHLKIL